MKILISAGFITNIPGPTLKIIYSIKQKLYMMGHDVIVAGEIFSDEAKIIENTPIAKEFKMFCISPFVKKSMECFDKFIAAAPQNNRSEVKKKFIIRHPFYSIIQMYRYSPYFFNKYRMKKYGETVLKIAEEEHTQRIICVCSPHPHCHSIFNISGKSPCPIYLWHMDPWGLHCLPDVNPKLTPEILQNQELAAFEKAAGIFTTHALYRQSSVTEGYKDYLYKMIPLSFPNIIKPVTSDKCAFDFDSNYTNILFCGMIDDEYRSPYKFLNRILPEAEKSRLRFYFLGNMLSKSVRNLSEKYPDNLFCHDAVPQEVAFGTMQKADILLNLGNIMPNQVPSKIYDYFSLGKPIINVQKIPDCPSREYFDKYPLALTVEDFRDDCTDIEDFILKSKGQQLSFEKVHDIFFKATPEYVAQHIIDAISRH